MLMLRQILGMDCSTLMLPLAGHVDVLKLLISAGADVFMLTTE
jgi:hypothetical protein